MRAVMFRRKISQPLNVFDNDFIYKKVSGDKSQNSEFYKSHQIEQFIKKLRETSLPIESKTFDDVLLIIMENLLKFRKNSEWKKSEKVIKTYLSHSKDESHEIHKIFSDLQKLHQFEGKANTIKNIQAYIQQSIIQRINSLKERKKISDTEQDLVFNMIPKVATSVHSDKMVTKTSTVISDISLISDEEIGSGSFGIVYRAVPSEKSQSWFLEQKLLSGDSKEKFIIYKIILTRGNYEEDIEELQESLFNEGKLGAKLKTAWESQYPNVIPPFSYVTTNADTYDQFLKDPKIYGHYEGKGDLISYTAKINMNADMADRSAMTVQIIFDILNGIRFLHKQGVIHRDISARNILIDDNGNAKLGDFGRAKEIGLSPDAAYQDDVPEGPVNWMSPHSIKTNEHNRADDIYSFKVTIMEIIGYSAGMLMPTAVFEDVYGPARAIRNINEFKMSEDLSLNEMYFNLHSYLRRSNESQSKKMLEVLNHFEIFLTRSEKKPDESMEMYLQRTYEQCAEICKLLNPKIQSQIGFFSHKEQATSMSESQDKMSVQELGKLSKFTETPKKM